MSLMKFAIMVLMTFYIICSDLTDSYVTDFLVRENDQATFTCTKPEGGRIVWDNARAGIIAIDGVLQGGIGDKFSLSVDGTKQDLKLLNIGMDDNGIYRCYTLFQSDFVEYNVTVVVEPEWVAVSGPDTVINEGEVSTVSCAVGPSKPAPAITWTQILQNGTEITHDGTVDDVTLANNTVARTREISVLMSRDAYRATFQCKVEVRELNFERTLDINVDMNVKPERTVLVGFEHNYIDGDVITVSCDVMDAKPPGEVSWLWNGDEVNGRNSTTRHRNGTYDVSSRLQFPATPSTNGAEFICLATNEAMRDSGETAIRLIGNISIYYIPIISIESPPQNILQANDVTLVCQYQGNPQEIIDVTWLRNDQTVDGDQYHVTSYDNQSSSLNIQNIQASDKGSYQCQVSNAVGRATSDSVIVSVIHAPICIPNQKTKYGAAIGDIQITCSVEANPSSSVSFTWNVNGTIENSVGIEDDTVSEQAYGLLNYTVGSEADYQTIQCEAANGILKMDTPCDLYILPPGPATAPLGCHMTNVTSSTAFITCLEDFDGGSLPHYAIAIKMSSEFVIKVNRTLPEFELVGLTSNQTYVVRICVSNEQFWNFEACTGEFSLTTMASNDTVRTVPANGTPKSVYIAVGVSLGILLLIIIGTVSIILMRRKNAAKQNGVEESLGKPHTARAELDQSRPAAQRGKPNPSYEDDNSNLPIREQSNYSPKTSPLQDSDLFKL